MLRQKRLTEEDSNQSPTPVRNSDPRTLRILIAYPRFSRPGQRNDKWRQHAQRPDGECVLRSCTAQGIFANGPLLKPSKSAPPNEQSVQFEEMHTHSATTRTDVASSAVSDRKPAGRSA